MAGDIKKIPETGVAVDQGQVEAAKEIVYPRPGLRKRIGDHRLAATLLNASCQSTRGGVMPVSKSGSEDQD